MGVYCMWAVWVCGVLYVGGGCMVYVGSACGWCVGGVWYVCVHMCTCTHGSNSALDMLGKCFTIGSLKLICLYLTSFYVSDRGEGVVGEDRQRLT